MFHPLKMLIVSGRSHKAHSQTIFKLLAMRHDTHTEMKIYTFLGLIVAV